MYSETLTDDIKPYAATIIDAQVSKLTSILDTLKDNGTITSHTPYFLDSHGGDLNGFWLINGERTKLDELTQDTTVRGGRVAARDRVVLLDAARIRTGRRYMSATGSSVSTIVACTTSIGMVATATRSGVEAARRCPSVSAMAKPCPEVLR